MAEEERLVRTSHALVGDDGDVRLVDRVAPNDNLSRRPSALGESRGVIQLLDRHCGVHERAAVALADALRTTRRRLPSVVLGRVRTIT
jgi:hypothetical protein